MKPAELNKDASVRLVPVAMLSEFAVCLGNVRSYRHGTLGNEKKGKCYKFTSQAKGCGSVRFTVTQVGSALYIFQKVISVPQRTNYVRRSRGSSSVINAFITFMAYWGCAWFSRWLGRSWTLKLRWFRNRLHWHFYGANCLGMSFHVA